MGELTGLRNPRRLLLLAMVGVLGVAALLASVGPNPHTRLTAIQGVAVLFFLTVVVRHTRAKDTEVAGRPTIIVKWTGTPEKLLERLPR